MNSDHRPIGEDDLQAYVDDSLSAERHALVGEFLRLHPDAAARVYAYREQRDQLDALLAFKADEPIPARLRVGHVAAARPGMIRYRPLFRAAALALVCLLAGGTGGWFFRDFTATDSAHDITVASEMAMAEDAMSAHRTFVVEVAHPVEVTAANEGHLVQWLSKRLGRPLIAPNLSAQGFRLMGGRLLPVEQSAGAAQFMYDDDAGNRLTLYVRAGESGETGFRIAQQGGVMAFYWIDAGLGYVISGAVNRDRLINVAQAVEGQFQQAVPARKSNF